jgi:hypothetical protein
MAAVSLMGTLKLVGLLPAGIVRAGERFGAILISKGEFDSYLDLLRQAHLDANLDHVMCRNLVSIDWRGYVYDCDSTRCSTCR